MRQRPSSCNSRRRLAPNTVPGFGASVSAGRVSTGSAGQGRAHTGAGPGPRSRCSWVPDRYRTATLGLLDLLLMMIMIWVNFGRPRQLSSPLEALMPRVLGSRRLAARTVVLLAAAVACLIVAACGSSGSSSGSSGSGSGLSAADKAGLTKAQSLLTKYEQRPTQITSTVKISKPVPKGKTAYFIACGSTPECTQEGAIVTQADNMLGWKTVVLN